MRARRKRVLCALARDVKVSMDYLEAVAATRCAMAKFSTGARTSVNRNLIRLPHSSCRLVRTFPHFVKKIPGSLS
jgi:hypothetical protein